MNNYPNDYNYTGTMPPYQNIPNITTPPISNDMKQIKEGKYAEDIVHNNIGNYAQVYMSYPNLANGKNKIFAGTIKDSGRDYLIIQEESGEYALLWTIYLDYIIFPKKINFE